MRKQPQLSETLKSPWKCQKCRGWTIKKYDKRDVRYKGPDDRWCPTCDTSPEQGVIPAGVKIGKL